MDKDQTYGRNMTKYIFLINHSITEIIEESALFRNRKVLGILPVRITPELSMVLIYPACGRGGFGVEVRDDFRENGEESTA